MNTIVLKGRKVVGGFAEGEALVTKQTISTWGGVNALEGKITERGHELQNVSFAGKILIFPSAKGSSGWSSIAQLIRFAGKHPYGMLINQMNSLSAMGAVVLRVPVMTDFNEDPTEIIKTGDWVKINSDEGVVEVSPA
jgi:predicted aconitase with swiveling domain